MLYDHSDDMNNSNDTIGVTTFSCVSQDFITATHRACFFSFVAMLFSDVKLRNAQHKRFSCACWESQLSRCNYSTLLGVTSPPSSPPSTPTRERQPDGGEGSLASSPLEAMRGSNLSLGEKQEDADNQKNSTRASQAGLNSNTIHIPVTITAPPGETTIIPSE